MSLQQDGRDRGARRARESARDQPRINSAARMMQKGLPGEVQPSVSSFKFRVGCFQSCLTCRFSGSPAFRDGIVIVKPIV